ncbi:NineTeen Complex (NTC) component [Hypoxylon texense]
MDPASVPFPPPPPPAPPPGSEPLTPLTHANAIHHHAQPHPQPQPQPRPPQQSNHFRVPTLSSHPSIDLSALESNPTAFESHLQRLHAEVAAAPAVRADYVPHPQDGFDREPNPAHMLQHTHTQTTSDIHHTPHQQHASLPPPSHSAPPGHGQFGILAQNAISQPNVVPQLQQDEDLFTQPAQAPSSTADGPEQRPHGQLVNRIVVDPPDLQAWRDKLFNVDDTIVLTNDEFETYFPHIDNVYSHRSTQKYKRKPFISHYWDCRMKGRPPGTPKSDDPSKKKRKRSARERDLCDVKIKITEYFPGATILQSDGDSGLNISPSSAYQSPQQQQFFSEGLSRPMDAHLNGEKFWTIQRVNGNGGNGKGDGVAGPHKHSLEKSDEIKKSTVQRYIASQEKEAKKIQKPLPKKISGTALVTAKKHTKDHDLKLYAACFCPFSQRRPTQLLEANPRGLVPAIREGDWASGESTIILEYLEDHDRTVPLFPTDPRLKANCRLWIDHINAKIVPDFFALARATDFTKQTEYTEKLRSDITALVQAADERGPYFLGGDLCLVDIHFAPFVLRMTRILRELRHWGDPMPRTRWQQWAEALEQNPHVQATTSLNELYIETLDLLLNSRQPHGEHFGS